MRSAPNAGYRSAPSSDIAPVARSSPSRSSRSALASYATTPWCYVVFRRARASLRSRGESGPVSLLRHPVNSG
jgi:hypothetical protein